MTEQSANATKKLLELRRRVKRKKPKFLRSESWRYKRLKENWRKPRGIDHKMRRKIKGWPPTVNVGYRGPKAARGLHPSGCKEVLIYNSGQVGKIDPETQAIRIAHTVGKRKRARILVEARKRKITVLNIKEAKEAVKEKELVKEEKEEKAEEKREPEKKLEEVAETEKPKRKRKKTKKRRGGMEKQ